MDSAWIWGRSSILVGRAWNSTNAPCVLNPGGLTVVPPKWRMLLSNPKARTPSAVSSTCQTHLGGGGKNPRKARIRITERGVFSAWKTYTAIKQMKASNYLILTIYWKIIYGESGFSPICSASFELGTYSLLWTQSDNCWNFPETACPFVLGNWTGFFLRACWTRWYPWLTRNVSLKPEEPSA